MSENKNLNYTYILKCSDGSLYCGWTNNLVNQLKDHNSETERQLSYKNERINNTAEYSAVFGFY